jgi:hypothetical protein
VGLGAVILETGRVKCRTGFHRHSEVAGGRLRPWIWMDNSSSSSSLLSRSFASALYLVALQLASRLVTFALNQTLLRLTTPAAFGTATIHLELLVHTIVFLSGEGIKDATLRAYSEDKVTADQRQRLVNASYVPLFICGPLAVVCCLAYMRLSAPDISKQPFFGLTVVLYGVAAVFELASLPFFIRARARLDTRLRVTVEGSAVLLKAITALIVMYYMKGNGSLLAYGLGQIVYGGTLLARYSYAYAQEQEGTSAKFAKIVKASDEKYVLSVGPSTEQIRLTAGCLFSAEISYFDPSTLNVAYALTKQSVVLLLLSEGDKFVVAKVSPVEDQGGYAAALNYGEFLYLVDSAPGQKHKLTPAVPRLFGCEDILSACRGVDSSLLCQSGRNSPADVQAASESGRILCFPPRPRKMLYAFWTSRHMSRASDRAARDQVVTRFALAGDVSPCHTASIRVPHTLSRSQRRHRGICTFGVVTSGVGVSVPVR